MRSGADSVVDGVLSESDHHGDTNVNAAWSYPTPKDAAAEIKDHIAFWKGVEITA